MNNWLVIGTAIGYLAILSAIAWFAEHRRKKGRSLINNGYVYALSMAVYCTAWTYYGSVGRAAGSGIEFLTIYLGPTIMCALFWPVLRKVIRICKTQRINSLADLVSTRYGKNFSVAVIVTVFCVLGVIPYISLQLKAISVSFDLLTAGSSQQPTPAWNDSTLYITLLLTAFIIFFGARSVDASEKHEGLVAAIAFESVIKLLAFIAAGLFISFGIFNGVDDIFTQAARHENLRRLFVMEQDSYSGWFSMILLSCMAIIFLPRQFQVNVVENLRENHLNKAAWFFPLYLFVINLFVLPIALGGSLLDPAGTSDADMYVLSLPMAYGREWLSLFIFVGGFSAATGMIIVETLALTTMISNNLALPLILSSPLRKRTDGSLQTIVIWVRRFSILLVLALAFLYDKAIAQQLSLVSIGLVSFAAVAQLAPAVLGGIYWKGASKNGAIGGLVAGFLTWFFTLVVPSMASAGIIGNDIMENGLMGFSFLKPYSLFGVEIADPVSHSLFWSLLLNSAIFYITSLYSRKGIQETYQGEIFVDIFLQSGHTEDRVVWKGNASMPALNALLQNFLGAERAGKLLQSYAQRHQLDLQSRIADPRLVSFSEKVLSGVIGSASAHIMVSSVTKAEELSMDEVINMLRESQQVIELNKELRRKSAELSRAGEQLRQANLQLKEMDELKDEFLYTVTHELRTPLTSIRALTEIVHDNPDMPEEQQQQFLASVIRETERLSHLITQVLNLERYESGRQKVHLSTVNMTELIREVAESTEALRRDKDLLLQFHLPDSMILVECDRDLVRQVLYNLLSNAIKFTPEGGRITLTTRFNYDELQVWVCDTGKGVPRESRELIFDKFFQARNQTLTKPEGSGLGLAICKKIVELHQGKIWVESSPDGGACFIFTLPSQKTFFLNG